MDRAARERDYEIILELSQEFPVKLVCEEMGIHRSSFYAWRKRLEDPCERKRNLARNIELFRMYHEKYLAYGYRRLNAKIREDTGNVMSDMYAHKCCKIAGIRAAWRKGEKS